MLQKRIVLISIIATLLLFGIIVAIQLNFRNQMSQSVSLNSIAMISATNGWAVGESSQSNPLILHYDGNKWKATKNLISDPYISLSSIEMVSSTEGWIVGGTSLQLSNGSSQSRPSGIILHYIMGKWTIISDKTVPPISVLHGLFILSARNIWAVGNEGTILHYDGTRWTKITSPAISNTLSFTAVSATSSNDVWVVGLSGILLHYDGITWKNVTASIFDAGAGAANLLSISMLSARDGWIVGNISNSSEGLILHYSGGQWQEIQNVSIDQNLQYIFMLSPTDGWAVGDAGTLIHYTNYTWTNVKNSTGISNILLSGISLTSSHDGWAVGDQGTILHYQNNIWNIYNNIQY